MKMKILFAALAASVLLVACENKSETGLVDTTKVDTTKVDTVLSKDTIKTSDTVLTVKKDTITKK